MPRAVARSAIAAAALLCAAYVAGARAPGGARSALDSARDLLAQGADPADPAVQALVGKALRRDVTIPAGIEMLALARESRGDPPAAARLYRLSDRISRRSLPTRLWLAQEAVERGDVAATLAHMDIALRTSSAAPTLVFPALARGLEDAALVEPIAALVDRPSDWREAFLIYLAERAEPESAAALFLAVRDRRLILKNELDRTVIARLVDDGQFSLAGRTDRAFASNTNEAPLVADGQFDNPAARYPFGWGITDTREIGASRDVEDGRSVLAYHANSAEGGQVAAQLLMLQQGRYVLETGASPAQRSDAPPLWVLSCAGQERVIATIALVPDSNGRSASRFAVPAGCPAQWLSLAVRPALAPQSGRVDHVRIARQ